MTLGDRIKAALVALRAPKPAPAAAPAGYRSEAPLSLDDALGQLESHTRALALRVVALERQLAAQGIEPATTPNVHELRQIQRLLDALGRCENPNLNTLELRLLASSLRGLTTWGTDRDTP